MTTDELETFVPESEPTSAYEKTFGAMIEGNDDATEKVMDDYPEYWIG